MMADDRTNETPRLPIVVAHYYPLRASWHGVTNALCLKPMDNASWRATRHRAVTIHAMPPAMVADPQASGVWPISTVDSEETPGVDDRLIKHQEHGERRI